MSQKKGEGLPRLLIKRERKLHIIGDKPFG